MAASKPTGKRATENHHRSNGDELHPRAGGSHPAMTTDQGIPVADNQNSCGRELEGPRCWKTSSFARRSPTSITNAFPSASCTHVAARHMATSS